MNTTRVLALTSVCGLIAARAVVAQPLAESFDAVGSLAASGWASRNNSSPLGTMTWFQGDPLIFPSQSSAGYLAVDYRSVDNVGTISNWQIMPVRTLSNGDSLHFWTRTVYPPAYADRLQVRMSAAGSSSNVGSAATDVGDFSSLLLDINPNYWLEGTGSYPTAWTPFTVTISGLAAPTQGRLAFRYFVEHGGANGSHSDYIGIDSLEFAPGGLQTGRCCITSSGACLVATALECSGQGGVYAGNGTNCTGSPCPPAPTGACCTAVGGCSVLTASACAIAGGAFHGNNSSCASVSCPQSFAYVGTPVGIQDGAGSDTCGPVASASVDVTSSFQVAAAEVAFVVQHPWQGDLKVRLSKVGGPTVTLMDRPGVPATTYGFESNNLGVPSAPGYMRISDSGVSVYDLPAVAAPGISQPVGTWKPESSLGAFSGLSSSGLWRLDVSDCAGGEWGSIDAFVLILTPVGGPATCYANCDGSTANPVLTANDFQCFLNRVAAQDPAANCDQSTSIPLITANDFQCFLNKFAAGCS